MGAYVIIPCSNRTLRAKPRTCRRAPYFLVLKPKFIPILIALPLAGCARMPDLPTVISPYRIDIQQGNVVTQEMVAKLKPGMTRSQVRFALGSPLIVDPFRNDRWDYVYTFQRQGRPMESRRVVVIFENDKLLRVEGDVVPQDPAAQSAKPPAKPEQGAGSAASQNQAAPSADPNAAASATDRKESPAEEKGFFGRMLEKIGL